MKSNLKKQIKFLFENGIRLFLTFIYPKGISKTIQISNIKLSYNTFDKGGHQYMSSGSWNETTTKLYGLIEEQIKPKYVIDVGANYGFLTCVFSKCFLSAQIISIEPVSFLNSYLKRNIKQNNLQNVTQIQSMCGESVSQDNSFSVNPVYSQDSRVEGTFYWRKEKVQQTTINELMKNVSNHEGVFIKVDTQGFEPNVMKGGEVFFKRSSNWFVKMEFSPYHINKQEFSSVDFLLGLIEKYNVYEDLGRVSFKEKSLSGLLEKKIDKDEVSNFIEFVKNKKANHSGQTDLLLTPKK
jgi:FkbM family methyltransferase